MYTSNQSGGIGVHAPYGGLPGQTSGPGSVEDQHSLPVSLKDLRILTRHLAKEYFCFMSKNENCWRYFRLRSKPAIRFQK